MADQPIILAIIEAHLSTGLGCRCGQWKMDTKRRPVDPRAQHREHVTDVLAASFGRALERRIESALLTYADEAELWADEDDPDGRRHWVFTSIRTVVPSPGDDRTSSTPPLSATRLRNPRSP